MITSTPLYPYQARVRDFCRTRTETGIFAFYGAGKTYLALQWLDDQHAQGRTVYPAIVLCKKSNTTHWHEEVLKHTSGITPVVLTGSRSKKATQLGAGDVVICNHDAPSMPHGTSNPLFRALEQAPFRAVIVDESTKIKNSRTERFKALNHLFRNIPLRCIMSGRPITEEAEDIFAQMLFLDQGETFGKSFWRFRDMYFKPGPPWAPYDWTLKHGAGYEIAQKMGQRCIRIPKSEVQNQLPPKRFIQISLEMPVATRKCYEELRKEFRLVLEGETVVDTQWAVVRSTKMHQLCQGFLYQDNKEPLLFDNTKVSWVEDNIADMLLSGPVLIWSHFLVVLDWLEIILRRKGIACRKYYGGRSLDEVQDFKKGKVDVLLLGEDAGHAGLDLWRANQAIFMNNSYKAEQFLNKQDRCHRIGSEIHEAITYWNLTMLKSIDTAVLEALDHKYTVSESILRHIREE